MKTINGKFFYQVEDLLMLLKQMPKKAIIYGIYHDEEKHFHKCPIYKVSETADGKDVNLSIGDNILETPKKFKMELIESINGRIKFYKENNRLDNASTLEILLNDIENNQLLDFMKRG